MTCVYMMVNAHHMLSTTMNTMHEKQQSMNT